MREISVAMAAPATPIRKTTTSSRKSSKSKTAFDKVVSSAANTIGREVGKSLIRGILGNLKW